MLTGDNTPSQHTPPPVPPSTLLHQTAQRLTALGMDIRECRDADQLTEIAVTNPRDPERGRAIIDREGFLTWERWCGFRTSHDAYSVAQAISVLLDDDISQQFQAAHRQPTSMHAPEPAPAGIRASISQP